MRIRIYDTEGQLRYGRSEDDQRNRFVSEVYRNAKLRFLIDTRGDSFRVLCYVRAVESEGQRSEQFYVDMVSDSPVELSEFKREAVGALRKVFHEIDLSNPTTDVFEYLDANLDVSGYLPEDDLHAVRSLADQGERLDFGAGDQRAALSVMKALGGVSAKVVIADAGRTEYYDDAEVVLDTGFDGEGIAASNQTTEKIQHYLEHQSKSAAEEKIETIEKQARELKNIKREEGLSDSEVDKPLRNALKTQFPGIFRTKTPSEKKTTDKKTRKKTRTTESKTTEPETTTKPTSVSSDAENSEKGGFIDSVPTKALGGVAVIALILLVVGGAAYTGALSDFLPTPQDGNGDNTGNGNGAGDNNTDGDNGDETGGDGEPNIMFAGDPLEGLPDKSWDDNSSQQIQGEVSNATESTTVEGVLRNSDGETVSDEDSADRGPFDLSYERDDIRSEMGYDDHDLTLNLSIYDGEEHVDSVEGEFSWDVRIPPTLTMTNDTVSVTNDSSTVSLDVENTGNTSGTWEVGLEVDGNETDNATIEALSEGEVHTVELTADSKLNPDNNVTVTCTAQQEDSVCESDRKQITVSEDG